MKGILMATFFFVALAAPLTATAQAVAMGLHLQAGATNVSGMRHPGLGLRAGGGATVALRPGSRLSFAAELGYARYGQVVRVRAYDGFDYLHVRESAAFHRIELSPLLEMRATGWLSLSAGPALGFLLGGRVRTLVETGTDGSFSRRLYTTRLGPYYNTVGFGLQVRAGFRLLHGLWLDLAYLQGLHDTARWWTGAGRAVPQGLLAGLRWMPTIHR